MNTCLALLALFAASSATRFHALEVVNNTDFTFSPVVVPGGDASSLESFEVETESELDMTTEEFLAPAFQNELKQNIKNQLKLPEGYSVHFVNVRAGSVLFDIEIRDAEGKKVGIAEANTFAAKLCQALEEGSASALKKSHPQLKTNCVWQPVKAAEQREVTEDDDSLSAGEIVGIVIGSVLAIVLVVVVVFFMKGKKEEEVATNEPINEEAPKEGEATEEQA